MTRRSGRIRRRVPDAPSPAVVRPVALPPPTSAGGTGSCRWRRSGAETRPRSASSASSGHEALEGSAPLGPAMSGSSASGRTHMAHQTVTSADGTPIAYETFGSGPALIVVCGATCDRALMRPTARALGEHFATVNFDRRGRGDSGDTLPYDIDREIEDIAALIDAVAGRAHVYGHSSGAALVLRAVAADLAVDRFVLHDPPYSPEDESAREAARYDGRTIRGLLAENRRGGDRGVLPPHRDARRGDRRDAGDPEVVGAGGVGADARVRLGGDGRHRVRRRGAVPADVAAPATRPGLVLVGGASPPFMMEVSLRLADLLPEGSHHVVQGHGHVVPPEVLAPVVAQFLHG
jgi:hypothetical protein